MTVLLAKNRKALHDHIKVKDYIAGISLVGHEVKAIREGKASFEGSYVQILEGAPVVLNLYIGDYSKRSKSTVAYDSKRTRKLLLHNHEINEIKEQLSQKGFTAVPLALVLDHNLVKLELSVVKGKKEFEKKQTAKERQIKRDLEIEKKQYRRTKTR